MGTPVFDIHLDQLETSLRKAFKGAKEYFEKILAEDSVELPHGKLVTHPKGCVLFRTTPSATSIEAPIYALYRTKDLYLDSFWSDQRWYRFADYDRSIILPPEIPSIGTVVLDLKSKYGSLGCWPKQESQIKIGEDTFRKRYNFLLGFALIFLCWISVAKKKCKEAKRLKKALLYFVALAEALRFPE